MDILLLEYLTKPDSSVTTGRIQNFVKSDLDFARSYRFWLWSTLFGGFFAVGSTVVFKELLAIYLEGERGRNWKWNFCKTCFWFVFNFGLNSFEVCGVKKDRVPWVERRVPIRPGRPIVADTRADGFFARTYSFFRWLYVLQFNNITPYAPTRNGRHSFLPPPPPFGPERAHQRRFSLAHVFEWPCPRAVACVEDETRLHALRERPGCLAPVARTSVHRIDITITRNESF